MPPGATPTEFDGRVVIEHSIALDLPASELFPALAERARERGAEVTSILPGRRLSTRRGARPRITIEDITLEPTLSGTRLDYRIELALDGVPRDTVPQLAREARGSAEADARAISHALTGSG